MSGLPRIPIGEIHAHPSNVREDLGDLGELAASIRAVGLLQPLVVVKTAHGWVVLDGHRRLAAARIAGARSLPCLEATPGDQDQQLTVMLAAAMHKQLTPVEQAAAFQALRNSGLTIAEIARRTGYSGATVSGRLLLRSLPDEVTGMVTRKELTVAQATELARQIHRESTGTATPKVTRTAWLTRHHALAATAAAACTDVHHAARSLVGGVACGQCWEQAIRDDAIAATLEIGV